MVSSCTAPAVICQPSFYAEGATSDDRYGGSVANRCGLCSGSVRGHGQCGWRRPSGYAHLPGQPVNDMHDDDPQQTFAYLLRAAADLVSPTCMPCAYPRVGGQSGAGAALFRRSPDRQRELSRLRRPARPWLLASLPAPPYRLADNFIANPDLVARFRAGAPLAKFDPRSLYAGGASGYSDYPAL